MTRAFPLWLAVLPLLVFTAEADAQTGLAIGGVDAQIADAMAHLEQKQAHRARLDSEIEGLAERRTAAQSRLRTRTRALYRITRAGMLPLAGGFPALLSHLSRVDRLERMTRGDARGLASLTERGRVLREQTGQLATDVATAEANLATLQGQRARLDQVEARTDFWDRGFGTGTSYQVESGWGSLSIVGQQSRGPVFRTQRGRLGMPVAGRVDMRPAERGDGAGIEFFASHGATVHAVEEGRVAYVDRQAGYGPMVIVDHGESYFTVYGGIAGTSVAVGDRVPRGGRLGAVGGGAVFFQVRRGTRALDANAWLGL